MSPRAIHDLHRDLRRLRIALRLLRRVSPGSVSSGFEREEKELVELAHAAGAARDRDVALRLLGGARGELDRGDTDALRAVLEHERSNFGKRLRVRAKHFLAQGGLEPRVLSEWMESHPLSTSRLRAASTREIRGAQTGFQQALRQAQRRSTVRRLHRLRVVLRQWRQTRRELAVDPEGMDLGPSLVKFQTRLGNYHDLGMFDEWVRSLRHSREHRRVRRWVKESMERRRRELERDLAPSEPRSRPRGKPRNPRSLPG